MPTNCVIVFENNPSKVFYGGQLLKGSVTLTLTSEKTVRGIYIKITGDAYAHWSEGSGKSKKSYTGEESYLNERTYFVGGNSSGDIRVSPGRYEYNFQCQLPVGLPTSLEGDIGYIRYCAIVKLDIPMWPDKEFEESFTVIKPVNLNEIPGLREPVIAKRRKTFYPCCLLCCCESDPLKITGRVPVGGYTPGQTINVDVEANNNSDQDVSLFNVQLIKEITYHIYANSSRKKLETIVIIENELHGCYQSQNQTYRVNLVVPPIPPTDNTTSNICKVIYNVRIIGSVGCCHSNPHIELPIIIGSYPILDMQPMNANTIPYHQNTIVTDHPNGYPHQSDTANAGLLPFPPSAPSALPYLQSDPPTYEDAVQSDKNDGKSFKPKYPVYRRATSYSSND